jgi:hypothetical protein
LKKHKKFYGTIFGFDGADYGTSILKEIDEINDMIRTMHDDEAANEEHQENTNKKVIINVESQTFF